MTYKMKHMYNKCNLQKIPFSDLQHILIVHSAFLDSIKFTQAFPFMKFKPQFDICFSEYQRHLAHLQWNFSDGLWSIWVDYTICTLLKTEAYIYHILYLEVPVSFSNFRIPESPLVTFLFYSLLSISSAF